MKTKNICLKPEIKNNNYDVVIIARKTDLDVAAQYFDRYYKNLCPQNIVIITKITEKTGTLFQNRNVKIIDENKVLEGLTYETVRRINSVKTGWYFQQFLKMAYAYVCKHDQYLVLDGDTVPLTPLSFLTDDGKGVFLKKGEHFEPYFSMIDKLFEGKVIKEVDFSFIAECMLIKKNIMIEMIEKIEANNSLAGKTFFEKIVNAIDINGLEGCDFSEYETYGSYVWKYHRDAYTSRRIRSLREAMKFFEALPEPYILDYLGRDYDTLSFEKKHLGGGGGLWG
jgi:hypothetical protein